MLAIKNNIMAVNAARHLGISYDALAESVERLSSGLRINTAKDDAAGLAARELMRADIAVLQHILDFPAPLNDWIFFRIDFDLFRET